MVHTQDGDGAGCETVGTQYGDGAGCEMVRTQCGDGAGCEMVGTQYGDGAGCEVVRTQCGDGAGCEMVQHERKGEARLVQLGRRRAQFGLTPVCTRNHRKFIIELLESARPQQTSTNVYRSLAMPTCMQLSQLRARLLKDPPKTLSEMSSTEQNAMPLS